MRIDKYLKVSRVLKRRTVAQQACDGGRVTVNDKNAKPSHQLKIGDIVEIAFGDKSLKFEVLTLQMHVKKEEADEMYRII